MNVATSRYVDLLQQGFMKPSWNPAPVLTRNRPDILAEIRKRDSALTVYSESLLRKIRATAGAKRFLVRKLTEAEHKEIGEIHHFERVGWFMYRGAQMVVDVREDGTPVVFRIAGKAA